MMATATKPEVKKPTGYEILADLQQVNDWIHDPEVEAELVENEGVLPDWFLEMFEGTEGDMKVKIERYHLAAKHLETEAKSFKAAAEPYLAEAADLKGKGQSLENRAKMLRERARFLFIESGLDKYKGDVLSIFPQMVSSLECTVDPSELPDEWRRVAYSANKEAVKQHVKSGGDMPEGFVENVRIDVRSR